MLLLQLIINGVFIGAVYALLGLGFGVIFSTTRIFHFAHGTVFSLAAYTAYQLTAWGLPFLLAAAVSIAIAALLGILIEIFVYNPLRKIKASELEMLISSLGLFIFLQNLMILMWQSDPRVLRPYGFLHYGLHVYDIWFNPLQLITFGISFLLLIALILLLQRTKMGKTIRALQNDPELTELVGIEPGQVRIVVFALGSALAAVSALLNTMETGVDPNTGTAAILIGVIVVIIGGVGNYWGTALAGLVLGIAENIGIWQIPSQWKSSIAFGVLLLFIIFRPVGILGKKG